MNAADTVGRVTTRGYYDRRTGGALRSGRYSVYPPNLLKTLANSPEIAIVAHGMRNDSAGAASKARTAAERLGALGYGHAVIAFSYDSDVIGAHLKDNRKAVSVARHIAERNGAHLAAFLEDFARKSPETSIRLLGHSLGSEVLLAAARSISGPAPPVRSVHLFAASATTSDVEAARAALERVVSGAVKNYHYESDEELGRGHDPAGPRPAGLAGMGFETEKFQNVRVSPKNHRFVSYMAVLESFP